MEILGVRLVEKTGGTRGGGGGGGDWHREATRET
jgi:hypothetical protein